MCMETIVVGLYSGNIEMTDIREIYILSVSVYFVCGDQVTQPPTVTVGQATTERNVSLIFRLHSCHYDTLLSVEEKGWLVIFRYLFL
jgi:hypothetical protein